MQIYGGSFGYFSSSLASIGIEVTFAASTAGPDIVRALTPRTRLVWLETCSNPLVKMTDLRDVSDRVHRYNPKIIVAVDNTFLSPYVVRPLEHGVDLVMHSVTKYLGGHTDIVMGCLSTNNEELHGKLRAIQQYRGATPSSFDCYLLSRSLFTLEVSYT